MNETLISSAVRFHFFFIFFFFK
jgi:hypothetical protein